MKPARITTFLVVALVALRLGCGWLFFREGSKKLDSGKFASESFMREAKGPLAGMYLAMVPDIYGHSRRNVEETRQRWDLYLTDAAQHFDFDQQQRNEAALAYDRAMARLEFLMEDSAEDMERYENESQRLMDAHDDEITASVNYRDSWMKQKEQELDAQLNKWLANIDAIWDSYEQEVNAIAAEGLLEYRGEETNQLEYYGYFPLTRPGTAGVSAALADRVIPWFTFLVGVLLVLGLFTRVAAIGGAAFLLSVVAAQPPFMISAADTNYQIILLLALVVLAAIGAGRWGGLDFFLGLCWNKCCGGSRSGGNSAAPAAQNEPQQAKTA